MNIRRRAGLASLFALFLLVFPFSSLVQASNDYSVWVDPKNPLVYAGETCSFEITVTNEGDNIDNYTLEVSDNAGWSLELQENQGKDVNPGESWITTLSVTVPKETEVGFQNEVTIKAINSAGVEKNSVVMIGVLRGDVTNWGYVATGVGIVTAAIVIVLVLWKGGI